MMLEGSTWPTNNAMWSKTSQCAIGDSAAYVESWHSPRQTEMFAKPDCSSIAKGVSEPRFPFPVAGPRFTGSKP